VSSTDALNQAIIATADAIVDAKGNLGPKTINSIKSKVQTVVSDSTNKMNKGDKVVVNPAVVPPPPKKTPY